MNKNSGNVVNTLNLLKSMTALACMLSNRWNNMGTAQHRLRAESLLLDRYLEQFTSIIILNY